MALAAAAAHASAVPVTSYCRATLLATLVVALGSRFGAQRRVLPFGLKAGHHLVRADTAFTRHRLTAWTPQDSSRFPVVIIAAGGPAALEPALPEYLASHGFTVVRAAGSGVEPVAREVDDATPLALITWAHDSAATAALEIPGAGSAGVVLSIKVVRGPAERLRVVLPPAGSGPGAETRRYRTLCAVTQAILNAALEGAQPTLSDLVVRLRAAGVRETYIRAS